MRNHRAGADGWLGSAELPAYRAGDVVARLDDLPEVDPDHLYFDLLLLDAAGRTCDNHSGPCYALARQHSHAERSRFVRVVAELVRHAPSDAAGLTTIGRVLSFIREHGIAPSRLAEAAQLLDDVCSEQAVVASLGHVLELGLGEVRARHALRDVLAGLASDDNIEHAGLADQLWLVVRRVGKARARRYLRQLIEFDMVPKADLLGV